MNKREFWILNIASLMLVTLLLSHLFFARYNARVSNALAQEQSAINTANNLRTILNQLSLRIAKGSETDPNLRNVLVKHGLNVTLEIDGKKKMYP